MNRSIIAVAVGLAASFSLACGGGDSGPKVSKQTLAAGKQLYNTTCSSCHGVSGKGDGPVAAGLNPRPRDFGDAGYMNALTDQEIATTIKVGGGPKGMPQMPSHPQFQEEQLEALVAYVRTLSQ